MTDTFRNSRLASASDILGDLTERIPEQRGAVPTGFDPLDRELGGGLQPGHLCLLGGMPGVGKTVAALQWATHMAATGSPVIYACYEHDEIELTGRLLTMELGRIAHTDNAPAVDKIRTLLHEVVAGGRALRDLLETEPLLAAAAERVRDYGHRLTLLRSSGGYHGVKELGQLVEEHAGNPVLFVDYLQKISVRPEPADEAEKVRHIVEGLKDLALTHGIPVIALVAGDQVGLQARRTRLHHLRGSAALAYEADVVVLLNEKHLVVSKAHLAYDPVRAEKFKRQIVVTIEKNRGGPAMVDLEFRKDFANFRFDPVGGFVAERLVDEVLNLE
jgi:replicative DNA helicase